jgi:hypothetical protein
LYDQEALPILHHSLQRNISVNSFQKSFVEPRYQATSPAIMNPGAFAAQHSARPRVHNRSITSPAIPLNNTTPMRSDHEFRSGDDTGDDAYSDDEVPISRAQTVEDMRGVDAPHHATKQGYGGGGAGGGIKTGWRNGLRRLTSNSGNKEARDMLKGQMTSAANPMAKSPKVPKVPAAWLSPASAEP